ncbi:MAG: cupin domain-containing protein [Halovenus sp.]
MSDSARGGGPYHVVDPTALDCTPDYPCDRRSVTEALGLSMLALAAYTLEPGEQLPRSYHSHDQREECFHVIAGRLFVETPGETFEVPAGQLFVVEPGNPHLAYNPSDAPGPVEVLGVGAPQYDPAKPYEP